MLLSRLAAEFAFVALHGSVENEQQERVDGITSRLAFELRFVAGIELEAYQAYVETAVSSMLQVGWRGVGWGGARLEKTRPRST